MKKVIQDIIKKNKQRCFLLALLIFLDDVLNYFFHSGNL